VGKWERVKLGDICDVITDGVHNTPKLEIAGVPLLDGADIENMRIINNNPTKFISLETDKILSKRCKPMANDILVSSRGSIGKIAIVEDQQDFNIMGNIILCRPKQGRLNSKYVGYYLVKNTATLKNTSHGSSQKGLYLSQMRSFTIPIPPIEIQKKISQTLDTASELIALRKKQLAELDNLIKAVFYDMFGDPVINTNKWKMDNFGDHLVTIDSGWSPKCHDYAAIDGAWGVLKLSAVTSGKFSVMDNKTLPNDLTPDLSIEVYPGDLLFTRKNTKELVGACAYVFETQSKLMISDIIFRLVIKPDLSKIYLWKLFNNENFKKKIQSIANGSAGSMPNISKSRLLLLTIPVPPIDLQNQFAEVVTKIEEQKTIVQKAFDESQYLFDSLMSQYFE